MDFLVIGDPHAKPGITNERFEAASNYAIEKEVDIIVCLGDFGDFPSLSSYNKGKKSHEGRRYLKDLKAVHNALEMFNKPLEEHNSSLKIKKVKQFLPKRYMLGGNHDEGRIEKAVELNSELEGSMGIEDCLYEEYGWTYVPYRKIINLEGISFCHFFTSGNMDRPIGAENLGRTISNKLKSSAIMGHCHKLDLCWDTSVKGDKIVTGSVGCFFDHEEDWATERIQNTWWRGLALFSGVEGGNIGDIELITMKTLLRNYL